MSYDGLIEVTGRVNDFLNAGSVLSWDARTMMPKAGAETRSKQLATLAVAARNLLCSDEMKRILGYYLCARALHTHIHVSVGTT